MDTHTYFPRYITLFYIKSFRVVKSYRTRCVSPAYQPGRTRLVRFRLLRVYTTSDFIAGRLRPRRARSSLLACPTGRNGLTRPTACGCGRCPSQEQAAKVVDYVARRSRCPTQCGVFSAGIAYAVTATYRQGCSVQLLLPVSSEAVRGSTMRSLAMMMIMMVVVEAGAVGNQRWSRSRTES